jgi:hypothetical protein
MASVCEVSRHEHAVGVLAVVREGPADDKAQPGIIERAGRRECLRRAGLQAETPVVSPSGFIDIDRGTTEEQDSGWRRGPGGAATLK